VAGLNVGISSEMLAKPQLLLRGNKDLLFVIDGVPVNSDTWNISPDDIESCTHLIKVSGLCFQCLNSLRKEV
jgi:hypothetical protein